jgi:hypothetical protein
LNPLQVIEPAMVYMQPMAAAENSPRETVTHKALPSLSHSNVGELGMH